jgi:hypothetical protein
MKVDEPYLSLIRSRVGAVTDPVARADIGYLLAALDAERHTAAKQQDRKPGMNVTWVNDGRKW